MGAYLREGENFLPSSGVEGMKPSVTSGVNHEIALNGAISFCVTLILRLDFL
jgi:hypothetical protein